MEKQYIFQVKLQDIFPLSKKKKKRYFKIFKLQVPIRMQYKIGFCFVKN